MNLVMNQILNAQITDPEVEEEKTNAPEETHETTMVLWDCAPALELDEEEPNEEIQLSSINVTTRSKGPVMDEILILPNIRKIQKSMNNISSTTQTTSNSNLVTRKDKFLAVNKPVKIVENKIESNKKILLESDMGYDIVEDIKKKKSEYFFI